MNFLRRHWYDLGGFFAIAIFICILIRHNHLSNYQLIMWVSLMSLFCHQLEEYRIVGTFPGMLNSVLYKSKTPNRFPLNTNTAFCINVVVGWTFCFLAAVFAEKAIWLGIATIVVSIANTIAHTTIFNIKGKTFYNAGLFTSWILFVPCACFFFAIIYREHLVTKVDYLIGIPLGILINVAGIIKLIDWMAYKETSYVFDDRNLLPKDRKKNCR